MKLGRKEWSEHRLPTFGVRLAGLWLNYIDALGALEGWSLALGLRVHLHGMHKVATMSTRNNMSPVEIVMASRRLIASKC